MSASETEDVAGPCSDEELANLRRSLENEGSHGRWLVRRLLATIDRLQEECDVRLARQHRSEVEALAARECTP